MNQETLKAYLNLIQGLLTCPRGEEWILLRNNEKLVNTELVAVMEEVANHLAMEGKMKEAKYLHNWAGQLHHILTESIPTPKKSQDKMNAYIELIQALLSSPQSSHQEILDANQDLIGPELVKVMKQIANQIAKEGDQETANVLNNLAIDLNRTWMKEHEFEPTLKKEAVPDPWLSSDSEQQKATTEKSSVTEESSSKETSVATQESSVTEESPTIITSQEEEPLIEQELVEQPQPSKIELPTQQLQAIADVLIKLEATLASRLQPVNPLWYMDILEKAEARNWLLTTEEIEHLIGVKPHCHHHETSFHRGSWTFIKTGKIGTQTAWQVKKQNP